MTRQRTIKCFLHCSDGEVSTPQKSISSDNDWVYRLLPLPYIFLDGIYVCCEKSGSP